VERAARAAKIYAEANFGDGVHPLDWAGCRDPEALPVTAPSVAGTCVSADLERRLVRVRLPARELPNIYAGVLDRAPPLMTATARASWPAPTAPGTPVPAGQSTAVRLVP
jgi:hypothetical protein